MPTVLSIWSIPWCIVLGGEGIKLNLEMQMKDLQHTEFQISKIRMKTVAHPIRLSKGLNEIVKVRHIENIHAFYIHYLI